MAFVCQIRTKLVKLYEIVSLCAKKIQLHITGISNYFYAIHRIRMSILGLETSAKIRCCIWVVHPPEHWNCYRKLRRDSTEFKWHYRLDATFWKIMTEQDDLIPYLYWFYCWCTVVFKYLARSMSMHCFILLCGYCMMLLNTVLCIWINHGKNTHNF